MSLDELEKLCNEATSYTPVAWGSIQAAQPSPLGRAISWYAVGPFHDLNNEEWNIVAAKKDAAFIAASRDMIPKLIAVVRAAKKSVTNIDENHINIGVYRHLNNGDVSIGGDNWHELNEALKDLEK